MCYILSLDGVKRPFEPIQPVNLLHKLMRIRGVSGTTSWQGMRL